MQLERLLLLLLVLLRRDAKVSRRGTIKGEAAMRGFSLLPPSPSSRCTQSATFEKRLKTPNDHVFA